ncbi:GntR family transcriptional regulator [Dactylosporangium sp. CA-092794]|uniref:GntR family transcriptional regulator n=1 Tax=Dactylosporangium sp. CA-092794 TaxID=3239929 RepID=UPI003D8E55EE
MRCSFGPSASGAVITAPKPRAGPHGRHVISGILRSLPGDAAQGWKGCPLLMSPSDARSGASPVAFAPLVARPDNLTSLVFAAIRDKIVDASLPPGSSVSEATLAAQLNVSKTPVREALLRLRHIGLVEPTSRGLRVIEPSVKLIRDAFEFRADVEAIAGRYAAARSGVDAREEIERAAQASLDAAHEGRTDGFLASDRHFHMAVAGAAGNDVLAQTAENSFVLTQALRQRDVALERDFVPDAEEHVGIADAIRGGDQQLASARLAEHILRIMAQLLDAFPGTTPAGATPRRRAAG